MGKIVEAVGVAVGHKLSGDEERAKKIEAAMVQGIKNAIAAGVSLSDREGVAYYQRLEVEKIKD